MQTTKSLLENIVAFRKDAETKTLGQLLEQLRSIADYFHLGYASSKIETITDTYQHMQSFMRSGGADPSRSSMYHKLKQDLYKLSSQILSREKNESIASLKDARKQASLDSEFIIQYANKLATAIQDFAISALEGKEMHKKSGRALFDLRNNMFSTLITNHQLSVDEAQALIMLLLSDNVDETDKRLVLSALLISQRIVFDAWKFLLLCECYKNSSNNFVREYALMAIVFGMPDETDMINYPELHDSFSSIFDDVDFATKITSLQLQVFYSMNAEKDQEIINKEIMPFVKEHSDKMMNMSDLLGDTPIDEILGDSNDEKKMDELEQKIADIRKMQSSGTDVFYSGFSHMKRYAFFFYLINWFYPFLEEHPETMSICDNSMVQGLFGKLSKLQHICDSDKYSMLLGVSKIFSQLPEALVNALKDGEVPLDMVDEKDDLDTNPMIIRRLYLQGLYRFYNLYSRKNDFSNPFQNVQEACFLRHSWIAEHFKDDSHIIKIIYKLLENKQIDAVKVLLEILKNSDLAIYHNIKGRILFIQGDFQKAGGAFAQSYSIDESSKSTQKLLLESLFRCNNYDQLALYAYSIKSHNPASEDAYRYDFYTIISAALENDNAEVLQDLFQMTYEHPDDEDVRYILALGLIYAKRPKDALKIMEGIEGVARYEQFYSYLILALLILKEYENAAEIIKQNLENINLEELYSSILKFIEKDKNNVFSLQKTDFEVFWDTYV